MNAKVHERLATVDKSGRRLWVYADIIKGTWRQRRKGVAIILVIFYSVLPWLRWNGLPLLQFDIGGQKLIIAGSILGFSESPVLLALILAFAFGVFGITSVAGRIWCGWACPQTVFLDFIFRPIEKWIEGRPLERQKRDLEGAGLRKILLKTIKWSLYSVVSFIIANTFVAYFSGSSALVSMMSESPAQNPMLFGLMLMVFVGFLFNFGWFREQMCTLVCPYGRLQSVLLDKNSYIVGYDTARGEPRGKQTSGDCVDCKRCVQVCPTGIDIRNGLQLECINCSACIDACNFVMSKINRPPNLIKYTTEALLAGRKRSAKIFIRPAIYLFLATAFMSFAVHGAFFRSHLEVMTLKSRSLLVTEENHIVRNQIGFLVMNHSSEELVVKILSVPSVDILTGQNPIKIPANDSQEVQVFVQIPEAELKAGVAHEHIFFESENEKKDLEVVILGHEEKL